MITDRLYYTDSYIQQFHAEATPTGDGLGVLLNRSAFYPTSGGQLFDHGTLNGIEVLEVAEDDDGNVVHLLASPLQASSVIGAIHWPRRFDFMQQHTGQHLLSAVFANQFNLPTVAVHMGEQLSTVELAAPSIPDATLRAAEAAANAIVCENRPVSISFEDAAEAQGLRKASDRAGTLRIITIADLDKSACGGTHVRATGEIGPILIRKQEKIRGNTRLEFVCGLRAIRRARADYDLLSAASRTLSAPLEDVPVLLAAQQESAKETGKQLKRLTAELATLQGQQLYQQGLRRHWLQVEGPLDDATRSLAQAFTAGGGAVLLATSASTGAFLLAASTDAGLHCGAKCKELLPALGGKGGGSAQLAQGGLAEASKLPALAAQLGF